MREQFVGFIMALMGLGKRGWGRIIHRPKQDPKINLIKEFVVVWNLDEKTPMEPKLEADTNRLPRVFSYI